MALNKDRLVGLIVACLATTSLAAAQETINQATIGGRVVDPQGRPCPGRS